MGDTHRDPSPPPEPPLYTPNTKRKHQFDASRHHRNRHNHNPKKRKFIQTSKFSSNKFQPLRPRSPASVNYRKRKPTFNRSTINSSTLESNRKWSFSSADTSIYKDKVVVVSYNILGVENALKHPYLYSRVRLEFLEWGWRKELICNEINSYNAGILCLQEVDRFNDLDCLLRKDGFKGVFKARSGEVDDGCAIFWKDKLFTLLHEESIEFQSFGLRNNVAQFCVLKMIEVQADSDLCTKASKTSPTQSRSLVVGNIHVLFNPSRGDIKLGQVRLFLEKAYKLSQEWGSIPVILGGDLNSVPQSAMYQFLASSELDILLCDRRNISGQLEVEHPAHCKDLRFQIGRPLMCEWTDEEINLATGCEEVTRLQHHLKLHSAYCGIPGSCRWRDKGGEPLATSYHSKFMGTVDYIWHTDELVPVKVLETLPADLLRRTAGLPNERWGSDHLAIVCELAFKDDGNRALIDLENSLVSSHSRK